MILQVDDRILVQAAQDGDLDAFEALVGRHQPAVWTQSTPRSNARACKQAPAPSHSWRATSARPWNQPPDPRRLSVTIRLVVAYGPAIAALVQALRAIIDRHVPALTGAQLTHIDITIEDIATPTD